MVSCLAFSIVCYVLAALMFVFATLVLLRARKTTLQVVCVMCLLLDLSILCMATWVSFFCYDVDHQLGSGVLLEDTRFYLVRVWLLNVSRAAYNLVLWVFAIKYLHLSWRIRLIYKGGDPDRHNSFFALAYYTIAFLVVACPLLTAAFVYNRVAVELFFTAVLVLQMVVTAALISSLVILKISLKQKAGLTLGTWQLTLLAASYLAFMIADMLSGIWALAFPDF